MKLAYRVFCGLPAFAAAGLLSVWLSAAEQTTPQPERVNYGRPFEPPTRPALLALPPGAVEPEGWLRDWCLKARDGYTGHMDEFHDEFKRAWAADHKMTGDRLNWPNGAWPYEGGGYWFDGLVRLGYVLHDDALIQQAKRRLDVVVTHMSPQGILFLWWLNKNNPDDVKAIARTSDWPLWASGLLGRALVAYYAASGDKDVLRALEAAYSGNRDWVRQGWGMTNPWPAFETYAWTGNREIAAALTTLFSQQGGGKDTGEWSWNRYRRMPNSKPGAEANDHGVHFLESTAPWALGYLWTGNREFLDAALGWHDLLERNAMQPSGVPVADEYYGPTGAFRGTETCDVAGYLWSQMLLLTVSGQARLADRAERAFFNAGPATVARDFKTHVYFQSPNRIVDNSPPCPHGPGAEGTSYQAVHFPLCCTAALNRILPNYVMHMWMATYDNGLAATHYGPCKVSALVADRVPVELACRTDYPFNDVIEIGVKPARESTFPLSFRIPGWCKNAELSVNGTGVTTVPDAKGFVRVERLWKPGDTLRLRFPMSVSVQTGQTPTPGRALRRGLVRPAVVRPADCGHPRPEHARSGCQVELCVGCARREVGGRYSHGASGDARPMGLAAGVPAEVACQCRSDRLASGAQAPRLPAEPIVKRGPPERITLIPYGCTKFRISMFPITERVFQRSEREKPLPAAGK